MWSSQPRRQRSKGRSRVSRAGYFLNASEDTEHLTCCLKIRAGSQVKVAIIRPWRQRRKSRLREAAGRSRGLRFSLRPVNSKARGLPPIWVCFWLRWWRSSLALESDRAGFESCPPPRAGYVVCGMLLAPVSSFLIGFL